MDLSSKSPSFGLVLHDPKETGYNTHVSNRVSLTNLRQQLKQISREIDRIILAGGRVPCGDPLLVKYHRVRREIAVRSTPRLPGVPRES